MLVCFYKIIQLHTFNMLFPVLVIQNHKHRDNLHEKPLCPRLLRAYLKNLKNPSISPNRFKENLLQAGLYFILSSSLDSAICFCQSLPFSEIRPVMRSHASFSERGGLSDHHCNCKHVFQFKFTPCVKDLVKYECPF